MCLRPTKVRYIKAPTGRPRLETLNRASPILGSVRYLAARLHCYDIATRSMRSMISHMIQAITSTCEVPRRASLQVQIGFLIGFRLYADMTLRLPGLHDGHASSTKWGTAWSKSTEQSHMRKYQRLDMPDSEHGWGAFSQFSRVSRICRKPQRSCKRVP